MEPYIQNALAQANHMSVHLSPLQLWCGLTAIIGMTVLVTCAVILAAQARTMRRIREELDRDHTDIVNATHLCQK